MEYRLQLLHGIVDEALDGGEVITPQSAVDGTENHFVTYPRVSREKTFSCNLFPKSVACDFNDLL